MTERRLKLLRLENPAVGANGEIWQRAVVANQEGGEEAIGISMTSSQVADTISRLLWAGFAAEEVAAQVAQGNLVVDRVTVTINSATNAVQASPQRTGQWDDNQRFGLDFKFGTVAMTFIFSPEGYEFLSKAIEEVLKRARQRDQH